jgi:phosphoribosyl 1,2-cyclic phosphodiesterase
MKLKFWGVRGSIPTPDANKMKVGGNTTCLELTLGEQRVILDMGTGARALSKIVAKEIKAGSNREIIIILSHTHWDHIQGFPFFDPIYFPNANISIYGPAKANRKLSELMAGQMEYDYFPVKFSHIPSKIKFFELGEGIHTIAPGIDVLAKRHIHPGTALGYRIMHQGKSLVFSTDTEHFHNVIDKRVVELSEGADVLVHDAQYTDEEMPSRLGWGHSSWRQAVQVGQEAKVKKLILFHADPERTDEGAFAIEAEAKRIFTESSLAIEGNEIEF